MNNDYTFALYNQIVGLAFPLIIKFSITQIIIIFT
jgi:hypothetical protein